MVADVFWMVSMMVPVIFAGRSEIIYLYFTLFLDIFLVENWTLLWMRQGSDWLMENCCNDKDDGDVADYSGADGAVTVWIESLAVAEFQYIR